MPQVCVSQLNLLLNLIHCALQNAERRGGGHDAAGRGASGATDAARQPEHQPGDGADATAGSQQGMGVQSKILKYKSILM